MDQRETEPVMPPRIAKLERDTRGYPIPWNVLRGVDNCPLFTINDDSKTWAALRGRLCPICGDALERWMWFVGGPLSAFHPDGCYFDLPAHEECAEYALAVCPYLAAPQYLKRLDVINAAKLPPGYPAIFLDETIIEARPEIFVMVTGCGVQIKRRDPLPPYLKPGRPIMEVRYWRHGKRITQQEAEPWLASSR